MRKPAERRPAFAHKDLVVARLLVDQPDVFDMAAFHCRQAVEDSLTGLLVLFDADVPKIHDLSRLLAESAIADLENGIDGVGPYEDDPDP
jgi:HEPN domain-containing protein